MANRSKEDDITCSFNAGETDTGIWHLTSMPTILQKTIETEKSNRQLRGLEKPFAVRDCRAQLILLGKKRSCWIQCRRISIRRCCCKSEGSAFSSTRFSKTSGWKLSLSTHKEGTQCWQQRWSVIGTNSEAWKQVHTFMYVVCWQKPSSDTTADNCVKYNLLQHKDHVVWLNQLFIPEFYKDWLLTGMFRCVY